MSQSEKVIRSFGAKVAWAALSFLLMSTLACAEASWNAYEGERIWIAWVAGSLGWMITAVAVVWAVNAVHVRLLYGRWRNAVVEREQSPLETYRKLTSGGTALKLICTLLLVGGLGLGVFVLFFGLAAMFL